jgi:arylsulfatase A-like enzyme
LLSFFAISLALLPPQIELCFAPRAPFGRDDLARLIPLVLIGIAAAATAPLVCRTWPPIEPLLARLSMFAPWFLGITAVFVWLHMYRYRPGMSAWWFVFTGYLAALALLALLFVRASSRRLVSATLGLWVVATVAAGVLLWRPNQKARLAAKPMASRPAPVLLITVDTLRADALVAYGAERRGAAGSERLVRESIRFETAISSAPWTLPSMTALLSGLPPPPTFPNLRATGVLKGAPMLAENLAAAGYRTGALVASPIVAGEGLRRGFDDFRLLVRHRAAPFLGSHLRSLLFGPWFEPNQATPHLTSQAISWIEQHREEPFFLWLHYLDPHVPYDPPPELRPAGRPPQRIGVRFSDPNGVRIGRLARTKAERDWVRALYLAEAALVERELERLFVALSRLGLWETSLIVLTSDHGEEFWEHGGFEHGHSLYQEVVHVPLLLKLPGAEHAGLRVTSPVSLERILPTLLDLCSIPPPSHVELLPSLTAHWRATPASEPPIFTGELLYHEDRESVIFDGLKFISWRVSDRVELYDLQADPAERHDIAAQFPDAVATGRALIASRRQLSADLARRLDVARSESEIAPEEQLRALGYVQ